MAKKTKEDAEKTRQRLLDAAEQLFGEKGVSKTSLSDVAEAVGMTRGAVYWHFRNKGELFHALIQQMAAAIDSSNANVKTVTTHPLEQLKARCLAILTACFTNRRITNVIRILHQKCETSDEILPYIVELNNRFSGSVKETEAYFRQAIDCNILPADFDTALAAAALRAYLQGVIDVYLISPESFPFDNRLEAVLAFFFNGLPVTDRHRRTENAEPPPSGNNPPHLPDG